MIVIVSEKEFIEEFQSLINMCESKSILIRRSDDMFVSMRLLTIGQSENYVDEYFKKSET